MLALYSGVLLERVAGVETRELLDVITFRIVNIRKSHQASSSAAVKNLAVLNHDLEQSQRPVRHNWSAPKA